MEAQRFCRCGNIEGHEWALNSACCSQEETTEESLWTDSQLEEFQEAYSQQQILLIGHHTVTPDNHIADEETQYLSPITHRTGPTTSSTTVDLTSDSTVTSKPFKRSLFQQVC